MVRKFKKPKAKAKKRQIDDDGLIARIKRDGGLTLAQDSTGNAKFSIGPPRKFFNLKIKF